MKGQFDKMLKMTLNLVSGQFDVWGPLCRVLQQSMEEGEKSAPRLLCVSAFVWLFCSGNEKTTDQLPVYEFVPNYNKTQSLLLQGGFMCLLTFTLEIILPFVFFLMCLRVLKRYNIQKLCLELKKSTIEFFGRVLNLCPVIKIHVFCYVRCAHRESNF